MALKFFHLLAVALVSLTLIVYASYYTSGIEIHQRIPNHITARALSEISEANAFPNRTLDPSARSQFAETNASRTEPVPLTSVVRYNVTFGNASVSSVSVSPKTVSAETKKVATNPPKRNSSVVMTSDVYISGHSSPRPELCPDLGVGLRLMIFIMSAPSHGEARNAIRYTWGHFAARNDVSMAFFLGQSIDPNIQKNVEPEEALYGDIIRGNFYDSYSNLTLKTISMLEWVENFCPKAPWILKIDDDMFLNVPLLMSFIDKRPKESRTIYGKVTKKGTPKRAVKSKYYVSNEQFKGKIFPDFTNGPCYLFTRDCVHDLYSKSLTQPYVRLEDVYVTGILANSLKIARKHAPEFYNKKVAFHPCNIQRGISIHMVRYSEQFDLWKKLLDGKNKCTKS